MGELRLGRAADAGGAAGEEQRAYQGDGKLNLKRNLGLSAK